MSDDQGDHVPVTRAALVGLGVMSLGLACTEKGRSLVVVDVTNPSAVTLASVRAIVIDSSGTPIGATVNWNGTSTPFGVGVYLPKSVSGSVGVVACAFSGVDGAGAVVAARMATQTFMVRPGESTEAGTVALDPAMSSLALCAGGGTGGRGGAGGSTGGMSGSGGGGAGGASGSGGAGGVSGSGGSVGGTGGIGGSVGGAGGSGGRGGNAGTGGVAGTGGGAGSGGRGGTTGTGGVAGTGGRGGAAGTGGTGTGGTAGAAGKWGGAVSLSNVVGNKRFPSVAVDANGNAVVVYEQGTQVWSNRYDAITGWSTTPSLIDSRAVGSRPAVAVDRNGNYLAVWGTDPNSSLRGIWYSTSSNGTEWSTPPVAFTQTVAYDSVLAMNANGMAIVAWTEQISGGNKQVGVAVRPGLAANWDPAKVLRPADDNGSRETAVAVTGGGVALVGWDQDDGLGNGWISVWMQTYVSGTGWNLPDTFEKYTGHNAYGASIAANSGNQAIVTYTQISNANPPRVQLWARRFNNGSFATNALLVFEENSIDAYVPASTTIDDAGNATVAFAVETSTGYQVQTSRTAPTATSWPPAPTSMETDNTAKDDDSDPTNGYVTMPIVRSDPAGNVTLVWRKRTTASGKRFDLVSRRYTAAGGWSPQVPLEDNTTNSTSWPTLAVGANGTAVATWHFETSLEVWANVFH